MAVRTKITDEQERLFEKELLVALMRDGQHQFAFDGKLRVWSSRYNCELKAVCVQWDESRGDVVFVGAFMQGEPQMDYSNGFPLVKPELVIPFRECFNDLRSTPGFNENYLISKTRKAVMDKCLSYPMRLLDAYGAVRGSELPLDEFSSRKVFVCGGAHRVGSIALQDGVYSVRTPEGMPLSLNRLSLLDIQRLGEGLQEVNRLIRDARKAFIDGKNAVLPKLSTTLSERDVRCGEEAGLVSLYDSGATLRCCDAVARTFSGSYKDVFDERLHSPKEIDAMVRAYREGRRGFGFEGGRKLNSQKL